jgi:hypothetical protein
MFSKLKTPFRGMRFLVAALRGMTATLYISYNAPPLVAIYSLGQNHRISTGYAKEKASPRVVFFVGSVFVRIY